MQVGLIVEGPTDAAVLETLVEHVCREVAVKVLQPKGDRTSGWPGLKAYLGKKGRDLGVLRRYGGYCGVLIQADADVVGQECHESAAERWRRAEEALRSWAGLAAWPSGVYPLIPVMCLETWICASREDCQHRSPQMECFSWEQVVANVRAPDAREAMRCKGEADENCDREMVNRYYRQVFAPQLARHWAQVVLFCPVGAGKFDQTLSALAQGCGKEQR